MHTGVDVGGARQLFQVEGTDCHGWLVLQVVDDYLYVCAFSGIGAIALLRELRERARVRGLKRVEWHSFHRRCPRVLREFFPRVSTTDIAGEYRYSFLTGA